MSAYDCKKNVMNLQPMELIWNSEIKESNLTLNEKNEIVLKENNNKEDDDIL